jgi:hypothetical protein
VRADWFGCEAGDEAGDEAEDMVMLTRYKVGESRFNSVYHYFNKFARILSHHGLNFENIDQNLLKARI